MHDDRPEAIKHPTKRTTTEKVITDKEIIEITNIITNYNPNIDRSKAFYTAYCILKNSQALQNKK